MCVAKGSCSEGHETKTGGSLELVHGDVSSEVHEANFVSVHHHQYQHIYIYITPPPPPPPRGASSLMSPLLHAVPPRPRLMVGYVLVVVGCWIGYAIFADLYFPPSAEYWRSIFESWDGADECGVVWVFVGLGGRFWGRWKSVPSGIQYVAPGNSPGNPISSNHLI